MDYLFSCCGLPRRRPNEKPLEARISQNRIAALYDRIAPVYDSWGALTETRARNRAIKLADIQNGQHVLEVAVGTGSTFYEIVKQNPNGINIGIDLSPGMLARAKKRMHGFSAANYTLALGTAFDLQQVEDESIDVLLNQYMFDLIAFDDMDAVLREFKRVLKKGARLVLVNMTTGRRFGSRLYELIYRISPATLGGCRGVEMADKLQQHGFTVEVRETVRQMMFPSEVILARR